MLLLKRLVAFVVTSVTVFAGSAAAYAASLIPGNSDCRQAQRR